MFPIVGTICDKVSPIKIVPWAFMSRCFVLYMFYLINNPDSFYSYCVNTLMVIASLTEQISCDSIFNKNLPKETRGMFNGLYSIANAIAIFIYTIISGYAIDHYHSVKIPFFILAILDIMFVLLFVYQKAKGNIK